ncbi:MAG: lipid-A-disaccharide synthase [Microcoleaceae cyanobacterium]
MTNDKLTDILILSNGPGEITTWVRPTVKALRQQEKSLNLNLRISVILSPCPHAMGNEAAVVEKYPEVDRVQKAADFWSFLLWGKTANSWEWSPTGAVLFLGGDQFFTIAIAKRLRYRSVIYAEWEARWWRWVDGFGVMKPEILNSVSPQYHYKFNVIGDLMADVSVATKTSSNLQQIDGTQSHLELIGILPGSKPMKLALGVPFSLAIAQHIYNRRPQTRFVIPVAPTVDLQTLAHYANQQYNPILQQIEGLSAKLILDQIPYLETPEGLRVQLWTTTPAYDLFRQCHLCLTTIGANTAELGSLAIPMVVLIPTYQLDVMRLQEGIPGILANLPILGSWFARGINNWVLRQGKLYAWPNIWAKQEIVPELVGRITAGEVADTVIDYLEQPLKLRMMGDRLRQVRGNSGAADKLAKIVIEQIIPH